MNGTVVPDLGVTSDRALVAEVVCVGLVARGLLVVRIPWADPGAAHCVPGQKPGWTPGLALMLCDLEPESVAMARSLVGAHPARWLLVTSAPRGPLWGAMLDVGVDGILEGGTTLAELADAISALLSGLPAGVVADRAQLVSAWRSARAR